MFYRGHWCPYLPFECEGGDPGPRTGIAALGRRKTVAIMPEVQAFTEKFKSDANRAVSRC